MLEQVSPFLSFNRDGFRTLLAEADADLVKTVEKRKTESVPQSLWESIMGGHAVGTHEKRGWGTGPIRDSYDSVQGVAFWDKDRTPLEYAEPGAKEARL